MSYSFKVCILLTPLSVDVSGNIIITKGNWANASPWKIPVLMITFPNSISPDASTVFLVSHNFCKM